MQTILKTHILALACIAVLFAGCAGGGADKAAQSGSVEKLYNDAHTAMLKGKYPDAIATYRSLQSRYPYGRYAQQTQVELAYAYYKDLQPEAALAEIDRFIRLNPAHPHVEYAYYLKGLINFQAEDNAFAGFVERITPFDDLATRDPRGARESFEAFRDLVTRFPDSRYAADSRQRMAYLLNVLALHDLGVAKFYFDRGAFVATVNRAKYIVEHYQQAAAVEDALGIMAAAYQEMGLYDLTQDTLRILRTNFPTSQYLQEFEAGS